VNRCAGREPTEQQALASEEQPHRQLVVAEPGRGDHVAGMPVVGMIVVNDYLDRVVVGANIDG
jgi:hypothetical protein